MKLRGKYRIALGVVTAGVIGATSYGVYSTLKFDEEFQGKGWYYKGHKFESKHDAQIAAKNIIISNNKEYYEVKMTLTMAIEVLNGNNREFWKPKFVFGDNNPLKILKKSEAGKRIAASVATTTKQKVGVLFDPTIVENLSKGISKANNLSKMFTLRYEDKSVTMSKLVLSFEGSNIFKTNKAIAVSAKVFKIGISQINLNKEIFKPWTSFVTPATSYNVGGHDAVLQSDSGTITQIEFSSVKTLKTEDVKDVDPKSIDHNE